MAGLVPAIQILLWISFFLCWANQGVDARNKCGHDEVEKGAAGISAFHK
jgi:hypothetical protein